MNLLKQSALAASLSLALCGWANAASLGQLQVISQADQNFQATFQVHDVSPTGGSLTARLAPAKTYEQYRVTMPESAKGLKLALINKNPLTLPTILQCRADNCVVKLKKQNNIFSI